MPNRIYTASEPAGRRPRPGLVVVWFDGRPRSRTIPVGERHITIGRGRECDLVFADDDLLSRQHTEVWYAAGRFFVKDMQSRNGTWVDAERITDTFSGRPRTLRLGGIVLLCVDDLHPYSGADDLRVGNFVHGVTLRRVLALAQKLVGEGKTLRITGETGTGKEHVVREFHDAGPRSSEKLVVVGCERATDEELFGLEAGAIARPGLVEQADRGTLFFDELGDLAKELHEDLLRVMETGEVRRKGSSRARKVDVFFCAATHVDLERAVEDGQFHPDLLARFTEACVHVPPLRNRLDELPTAVAMWLEAKQAKARAPVIEALLLKKYRKNFRELRRLVTHALREATPKGAELPDREIFTEDLPSEHPTNSGEAISADTELPTAPSLQMTNIRDDKVLAAFEETGTFEATAKAHRHARETVRRILEAHGLAESRAAPR